MARETDAVDGNGASSSVFAVSVLLSRDCQNGSPDFDTLSANGVLSPTFAIVDCSCDLGWTGQWSQRISNPCKHLRGDQYHQSSAGEECQTDYDGCIDNPCLVGECVDVAANEQTAPNETYSCNVTDCTAGYERLVINGVASRDCLGEFFRRLMHLHNKCILHIQQKLIICKI